MLWPCAKSPTSPRRSATAALLARPPTAHAWSRGDKDQAQLRASFLEAFMRAAFLLLCEKHRKRRLCAPAAPCSLDHLTSTVKCLVCVHSPSPGGLWLVHSPQQWTGVTA